MLIIKFVNDGTGTPSHINGNYDYEVFVNQTKIAEGRVENHDRRYGWEGLLQDLLYKLRVEREALWRKRQ